MQSKLTRKQQRVLEYLQREIAVNRQTPSLRQAASELGVSHAAIAQILKVLEEKGYLKREGRYSRQSDEIWEPNVSDEPGWIEQTESFIWGDAEPKDKR